MEAACPKCKAVNAAGARFCRACGTPLAAASPAPTVPAAAATVHPAAPRSRALWPVIAAVCAALALAAGGGAFWYQQLQARKAIEAQQTRLEDEAKRQAELRQQAELEATRKRAEEADQARRAAEEQATRVQAEQEAARRDAERAQQDARRTAARERQERLAAEQRAQQEAERRRASEAAARAAARPAPLAQTPPMTSHTAGGAPDSPEQFCRSKSNFISRSICDTRECSKPQNAASEYCKAVNRARATSDDPSRQ